MSWSTPLTAVTNTALTAAQWNASVRDNLLETAPAKASSGSRFFATTGANTIVERVPTLSVQTAQETLSSTSYANLTSVGPALSVNTGTATLVCIKCIQSNDTTGAISYASYQVANATTDAATDGKAVGGSASAANRIIAAGTVRLHTGLNVGANNFSMLYRVSGGTGSWQNREISVLPF